MALLSVRNLTTVFNWRKSQITACKDVSLDIQAGQTLGLIGESGCGKSVLGMSVLRLLPDNAVIRGQIVYKDQELLTLADQEMRKVRGSEIGLLPQNPNSALNPVLTIGEQLTEGVQLHRGVVVEKARAMALDMLLSLGIRDSAKRSSEYPHQLSGGMKQRVLAAISMSGNPSLLIADEPTKGLDAVIKAQVVDLLRQLTRETGAALLLITHDLKVAAALCDEIAVMYCGEIVEQGPADQVLNHPAHPYTRGLVASLPERGLCPIPGHSPSLSDDITGCSFYSRCPVRQENCQSQKVANQVVNGVYVRCLNIDQSGENLQDIYQHGVQTQAV